MKKTIVIALISAFLFGGCAVGYWGAPHRRHLIVVQELPMTVELDADNYCFYNGYYYYYRGNVWLYSESRGGPWMRLPRSHYPHEIHYWHRGFNEGHGEGFHRER